MKLKILVIDDNRIDASRPIWTSLQNIAIRHNVNKGLVNWVRLKWPREGFLDCDFTFTEFDSIEDTKNWLKGAGKKVVDECDGILVDVYWPLPRRGLTSGIEVLLGDVRKVAAHQYIAMYTAHGIHASDADKVGEEWIVEALERGADDFIEKCDTTGLVLFLKRVADRQSKTMSDALAHRHSPFLNECRVLRGIDEILLEIDERLQAYFEWLDSTQDKGPWFADEVVFLEGEPGAGKSDILNAIAKAFETKGGKTVRIPSSLSPRKFAGTFAENVTSAFKPAFSALSKHRVSVVIWDEPEVPQRESLTGDSTALEWRKFVQLIKDIIDDGVRLNKGKQPRCSDVRKMIHPHRVTSGKILFLIARNPKILFDDTFLDRLSSPINLRFPRGKKERMEIIHSHLEWDDTGVRFSIDDTTLSQLIDATMCYSGRDLVKECVGALCGKAYRRVSKGKNHSAASQIRTDDVHWWISSPRHKRIKGKKDNQSIGKDSRASESCERKPSEAGSTKSFWETFEEDGWKLWTIKNIDDVRAEVRKALEGAIVDKSIERKPVLKVKKDISINCKVRYVSPSTGEKLNKDFTMIFKTEGTEGCPEPRYFSKKRGEGLYEPFQSMSARRSDWKIVQAAVLRYMREVNIDENGKTKPFRDGLRKLTSFVLDDEDKELAEKCRQIGLVNGFEATVNYTKASGQIFEGLASMLKSNPKKVDDFINEIFDDYTAPD